LNDERRGPRRVVVVHAEGADGAVFFTERSLPSQPTMPGRFLEQVGDVRLVVVVELAVVGQQRVERFPRQLFDDDDTLLVLRPLADGLESMFSNFFSSSWMKID
jgi:hypothetical protein